jgi:predicted nuclease with TOPRIM domain
MAAITKSNKQQGKLMRDVEAQAKLIRDAEANLGKSIEECHQRVEDAVKVTEDVKAELDALKTENHSLRDRVRVLEERLAATEQYSRVNDIEVHGVPYKKGENLSEILSSLGNALSCPVSAETVEVAHRIGKPSESRRGIYVRFTRKPHKTDFLQARKVKRDLRVGHLSCFPPGPRSDDPIYINESLSPEMRSIFNRARELKRDKYSRCVVPQW